MVQATIKIPVEVAPCGGFAFTETDVWTAELRRPAADGTDRSRDERGRGRRPSGRGRVAAGRDQWGGVGLARQTPAAPGYLARLSPEQDAVDLALSPGPDFGGGGDLVVAAGSAWVIDGGNDRVLRLPLAGFPPD